MPLIGSSIAVGDYPVVLFRLWIAKSGAGVFEELVDDTVAKSAVPCQRTRICDKKGPVPPRHRPLVFRNRQEFTWTLERPVYFLPVS